MDIKRKKDDVDKQKRFNVVFNRVCDQAFDQQIKEMVKNNETLWEDDNNLYHQSKSGLSLTFIHPKKELKWVMKKNLMDSLKNHK